MGGGRRRRPRRRNRRRRRLLSFCTSPSMPGAASRLGKERADWIQTQSIKLASDEVKIQQIFEKYDTNNSNALEFDQLKAFLSDTCAGTVDAVSSAVKHSKRKSEDKQKVIVTDEDVRFILLTCDKSKE